MTADRFTLTVQALLGEPWPMPAEMPGVVHACRDEPLTADELADVTEPAELARLLGVSRQRAYQLIQQRAATAQPTERTEP